MPRRNDSQIEIYCDEAEPELATFPDDQTDSMKMAKEPSLDRELDQPESPTTPNFYRTSLSSLPASSSSSSDTDQHQTPTRRSSKSPLIHSHRPSFQRYNHGLTPRSARSVRVRASPRPRTRERQEEHDRVYQPLVLLHITLLPVSLPWGQHIIEQVIPREIMQQFYLLREKATSHIMQRGILVDHPEGDMDLLKRRLLHALELMDSTQASDNHNNSDDDDDEDAFDSAISISGDDLVQTRTKKPREHLHTSTYSTWEIRIFAANGLMRADTWASAWNEMERVDVEIMPHIPSELRRELDLAKRREESLAREDEKEKKISVLEEQIQRLSVQRDVKVAEIIEQTEKPMAESSQPGKPETKEPLPPACRKREIPLSILLRNYLYLLAQDTRNITIFGLSLLVLLMSMQFYSNRSAALAISNTSGLDLAHDTTLQEYQHPVSNVMADAAHGLESAHVPGDTSLVDDTATPASDSDSVQLSTGPVRQWEGDSDEIGEIMSD